MPTGSYPFITSINKNGTMIFKVQPTLEHKVYNKRSHDFAVSVIVQKALDDYKEFSEILTSVIYHKDQFELDRFGMDIISKVLNHYPNFTGTFTCTRFRIPVVDGKLHTSSGNMCIFYDTGGYTLSHLYFDMGKFIKSPAPAIWYKNQFKLYTISDVEVTVEDLFNKGRNICKKFYNNENLVIEPIKGANWINDKKLISFGETDNMYWAETFYSWCRSQNVSIDKESFLTYIMSTSPKTYSKWELIGNVFFGV